MFNTIEKIIKEINRDKQTLVPIHLRFKSNLSEVDKEKPMAIIIGEQHSGSYKNLNYSKTNRTLTKFLLALYENQELNLGDALKEGYTEIQYQKDLESLSLEDFLLAGYNPLITALQLCNKEQERFKVYASESKKLFVKFSLLAYFLTSFPDLSRSLESEENRILDLIKSDLDAEKKDLIKELNKEIYQDLALQVLDRENLIKLQKENGLELYRFRFVEANEKQKELQEGYKYKALAQINKYALERDKYIFESFKRFEKGIHPIVIGEKHVANLLEFLKKERFPAIFLSSFTSS